MKTKRTTCPKCGNQSGFAFGTCGDCGWNHLEHKYHWIEVYPDALPADLAHVLIEHHDYNVRQRKMIREK